jgi:hypothetical protein
MIYDAVYTYLAAARYAAVHRPSTGTGVLAYLVQEAVYT